VAVVDVEDIYDEFSFGEKTPRALKDFIRYATTDWEKRPRYVLLAGDASYDPRNYLGFGGDLVPTKLVDTHFMETASDDWLTDFDDDGVPDLATGRLPFRTTGEASIMTGKVIDYERTGPAREALLVADANDGYDFEQASERLKQVIPPEVRVTQINRGRVDAETASKAFLDAIHRNQFVVNYIGHGSATQWRGNLLTVEEARHLTNVHRPLFVMMTCLSGFFQDPAVESLAESLLKADHGGAVAVWASSGLTSPDRQHPTNQQLFRLLFRGSGPREAPITLGEAILKAKARTSDVDVRRTWILFGDPTIRLR